MSSILSKKKSLKDLKILGHQLLSSKLHINNLPLLITFISPSSPPKHALESFISLHSFFTSVINHLPTSKSFVVSNNNNHDDEKDPELVYNIWLRSNFDEFLNSLFAVAVSPESDDTLREVALDGVMEFVKLGKGGKFQSMIYQRFLQAIVYSPSGIDVVVETLVSNFFNYIDVRYFTYITLEKLVRTLDSRDIKDTNNTHQDSENKSKLSNLEFAIHKIHYILSHIPPLETKEGQSDYQMWSELGLSSKETDGKQSKEGDQENRPKKSNSDIAKKMKLKFTKAWLSFLRLSLPLDVYKEVLVTLHQIVIPHLSSPIMLCDFLTRSYDVGGVTSVMALSSLYILMTQHGLEYPNFYEKLYALLEPSIFMAKHRAKFFELLDSCLKSPLLPAYLAAAFTKKLSRLSLVVPPSGALVVIAIIHNLLRRHPSINFLVQQQNDETDGDSSRRENENSESVKESNACTDISTAKPGIDMFNSEETDPAKSNAMRSSLWEIDTLRHHYCPAVSRFVASLENDLTVRAKTTEITVKDFSSASYATIFRAEIGRRIKQVPLAFYKASPASLFLESDFPGWSFKLDDSENEESGNGNNGLLTKSVVADEKSTKRQRIEC